MTVPAAQDQSDVIQSVTLAFQIMEFMASANRPVGVGEIALRLDIGKSRVFRHLQTLNAGGYVTQDISSDKYMPGVAWSILSARAANGSALRWIAEPHLIALASATGMTATLVQFESSGARSVISAVANQHISVAVPNGVMMPPHATAFGKIGLAFAEKQWVETFGQADLARFTTHSITDADALMQDIEQVRAQGWAATQGEWLEGISALAAPLRPSDGAAVAAVGLIAYGGAISTRPDPVLIERVQAAASAIASTLFLKREAGK